MRILFFAHLQSLTGCTEMALAGDGLDADALWDRLLDAHPQLAGVRRSVRLARNWEFAGPETRFQAGDEVALIPPVSGG
jgi:molybdopterin converting factor subunit 1